MLFGFLLYPGIEPIDIAAIGVVSMAKRIIPELEYVTIATDEEAVQFSNGLRVLPDQQITDAPRVDVLIVPGGPGWMAASADERILDYLRSASDSCIIVSVCTGAMFLAKAGLLAGKAATTKKEVVPPEESPLQTLKSQFPDTVARTALVVDEGGIVTGGGVSLCIDTVLYVLRREFGPARVAEVARILEYESAHAANCARLEVVDNR